MPVLTNLVNMSNHGNIQLTHPNEIFDKTNFLPNLVTPMQSNQQAPTQHSTTPKISLRNIDPTILKVTNNDIELATLVQRQIWDRAAMTGTAQHASNVNNTITHNKTNHSHNYNQSQNNISPANPISNQAITAAIQSAQQQSYLDIDGDTHVHL